MNAPPDARYRGYRFERFVRGAILLNVLALTMWSDPMAPAALGLYETLNYVFVVIFAAEAMIKITAVTFKEYVQSWWNLFDLALAAFGVLGAAATLLAGFVFGVNVNGEAAMRWMRCTRALRIVRLAIVSPSLLKMMRTMLFASPSIANITVGIFLFTSAYAQFGMAFLGMSPHACHKRAPTILPLPPLTLLPLSTASRHIHTPQTCNRHAPL